MADFDLVQILNTSEYLVEKATSFLIRESLLLNDQIKQFTIRYELHDQEQLPRRLNNLVQLHNIRVSDNLKYLYLPHDSGNVGLLLDFVFFKYFDCYFFMRQCMSAESDFSKSSLSNSLPYKHIRIKNHTTYPLSSFRYVCRLIAGRRALVGSRSPQLRQLPC